MKPNKEKELINDIYDVLMNNSENIAPKEFVEKYENLHFCVNDDELQIEIEDAHSSYILRLQKIWSDSEENKIK